MTTAPGKFRSLLATARIANVPSVVSNVWLGMFFGHWFEASRATCLTISAICLYVSGNFLNDWHDRGWDARNRSERALPRGLFSPTSYLVTAIVLAIVGIVTSAIAQPYNAVVACSIVAFIIIYTFIHKRVAWSVIPMGLCRAGLVYLGVIGLSDIHLLLPDTGPLTYDLSRVAGSAAGLFCYIVGLSMAARSESMPAAKRNRTIPILLFGLALFLPILSLRTVDFPHSIPLMSIGIIPCLLWLILAHTIFRKSVSSFVSALLAGIPLVDWIISLPVIGFILVSFDGHSAATFGFLLLPPLAFITGRLLQRLAPAT